MKKITATLLALLLLLSLSITAFATGVTNQSTITVNGAENGKDYKLYKIFDVTTVNGIAAYSVSNEKADSYTSSKFTDDGDNEKHFTDIFDMNKTDTVTYFTRKTGTTPFLVRSWAKTNVSLFDEAIQTVTAANATVEFKNVDPGYYYVESPVGDGANVMLADTSQTATINEKNSAPGWGPDGGKTVNGDTYYAGDTISYTLTYKNAVNYDKGNLVKTYTVEDKMDSGITLDQNSIVVKVNNTEIAADDLTVTKDASGFKVVIPWATATGAGTDAVYTSKYTQNPSTIEVTYTATMGNSVIATAINNTAKIYPDTNTTPGTETEKKETVYTGRIVLNKIETVGANKNLLSGAKFKVKVNSGSGDKYLKQEGTAPNYTYSEVDEAQATEFVTGADGKVTLTGLKAGTYIFVETDAPAGYQLPANTNVATVKLELPTDGSTDFSKMDQSREVENSKAAAMPETGGMGTTMFYAVGSLLAVTALVFLVTQKRMRTVR